MLGDAGGPRPRGRARTCGRRMTAAAGRRTTADRRRAGGARRSAARSCSGSPSPTCPASSTSPGSARPSPTSPPRSSQAALERRRPHGRGATAGAAGDAAARRRDGPPRRRRAGLRQRRRRAVRARARSTGADEGEAQDQARDARGPGAAPAARRRPARTRSSASTPTCGPRARAARWCAPGVATAPTTSAGRSTWESQALLRATPDRRRRGARPARSSSSIDPLRWPAGGLTARAGPRDPHPQGADGGRAAAARRRPARPTSSSGRGGLSDVEWTVQLLQLQHAHAVPALRTTATLAGAGRGARRPGCSSTAGRRGAARGVAAGLAAAQRRRAAGADGPSTACPSDLRDADGMGRILGGEPGTGAALAEDYRRVARRARAAVEFNFYDSRLGR